MVYASYNETMRTFEYTPHHMRTGLQDVQRRN